MVSWLELTFMLQIAYHQRFVLVPRGRSVQTPSLFSSSSILKGQLRRADLL